MTDHSLQIDVTIDVEGPPPDAERLVASVRRVFADADIASGQVGIAIMDDREIHQLNRQYLQHDYPTDVLSFVLASSQGHVEGEIAASLETARREAASLGWRPEDELLLYIVHGALHLVGFDDSTPPQAASMRRREREVLSHFGLEVPWDEDGATRSPSRGETDVRSVTRLGTG